MTIGEEADKKVRLQEEIPAIDASDKTVVLLAVISNQHQEAQAAAAFNAERARLAEWGAGSDWTGPAGSRSDPQRPHRSLGPGPRPTSRLQASLSC